MKLLAVRADKIGSKIIQWGTKEPASHLAVSVFDAPTVFHSYGTGIVRIPENQFFQIYEVVDEVNLPLSMRQEKDAHIYMREVSGTTNSYDYPALAYFAFRATLHKFFGTRYPLVNRWQTTEGYICTEVAYPVAEIYAELTGKMILPDDRDLAMVTPYQLLQHVKRRIG